MGHKENAILKAFRELGKSNEIHYTYQTDGTDPQKVAAAKEKSDECGKKIDALMRDAFNDIDNIDMNYVVNKALQDDTVRENTCLDLWLDVGYIMSAWEGSEIKTVEHQLAREWEQKFGPTWQEELENNQEFRESFQKALDSRLEQQYQFNEGIVHNSKVLGCEAACGWQEYYFSKYMQQYKPHAVQRTEEYLARHSGQSVQILHGDQFGFQPEQTSRPLGKQHDGIEM